MTTTRRRHVLGALALALSTLALPLAAHAGLRSGMVFTSSNDAACQAIINAHDFLADYKAAKIAAIKKEGLTRIQAVVPGIDGFDTLQLVRELWLSINSNARTSPTASMTSVINIYNAGRTGIINVNAATTKAQVDAVVVAWP